MKAKESNTPTVDDGHYAIAVYGVPDRMLSWQRFAKPGKSQLKKDAVIKRSGKGDLKPSSVEVLQRRKRHAGSLSLPANQGDHPPGQAHRIPTPKSSRLKFAQPFFVDDMVYQGKLEM